MDIILLQDVKTLGKKGELVKVNDGYARNFIFPKKLGIEATNKNMNDLKLKKANDDKVALEQLNQAKDLAKEIETKEVHIKIKVGEGGRTFGSISTKEISAAVKDQLGYDLDKKKMQLIDPIKSIGNHSVPVKIHPSVTASLKVIVSEL